ncbi:MAG: tetraacyldisaccharide 4'-kinase [Zoogloeaceae bacterium]|jgi:tetraacyldisaccharide 4'-kinase|nr:tetraacyldisaccharide 4'-kinase [Zoogloeaceae bacterium]
MDSAPHAGKHRPSRGKARVSAWLTRHWQRRGLSLALLPLAPLALLFAALAALRRFLYRHTWLRCVALPVPVVVVGNLGVGGTGKTPLVLYIAQSLQAAGWRPGILSRGYGRLRGASEPCPVFPHSDPAQVGDEPVLLALRGKLPVWVGRDRAAAGAALLARHPDVDVLICDDGLQHLRLRRDVEIAVFDGRGAGNGFLLPLGPLREPLSRLRGVDAVLFNGAPDARVLAACAGGKGFDMRLLPGAFYRLDNPGICCTADDFAAKRLGALAGIGHPERFFRTLEQMGLLFSAHAFPDHHAYQSADLSSLPCEVLLMTEKDGVKCARFSAAPGMPELWALPVTASLPPDFFNFLLEKLKWTQNSSTSSSAPSARANCCTRKSSRN